MKDDPIKRDENGCARTRFCREEKDGGLTITAGRVRYELSPERIADGPAFGQTLLDLKQKIWFTDEIQCDLTNVVTARWMAKARGWI